MKKIFLTGILSILFMGISFAQIPRIGITAGLNVSNVNESGYGENFKPGFQTGFVADFGITQNFSIMPELLFTQRGCKYDGVNNRDAGSSTLNYLQLPINAAYKFDVRMGSKVFVFAGPYFGYGISGTSKDDVTGSSSSIKFGSGYNTKPFDFGINVGVGYEYEKVFIKLQYNQGISNIYNYQGSFDNYTDNTNFSVRNQNIAITVGYYFN